MRKANAETNKVDNPSVQESFVSIKVVDVWVQIIKRSSQTGYVQEFIKAKKRHISVHNISTCMSLSSDSNNLPSTRRI